MAYYTITDGTTQHLVLDMEISESTNELDECAVLVDGKYADNAPLVISDNLNNPIFYGLQKITEQDDKSFVNYKLSVMEKAVEMQYIILTSGSDTTFNKNDTATNLINFAIAQVNTVYGETWTLDTTYFTDDGTKYTIGCYYTNAMAFIRKVVVDNLGLKLWFDSATKKVYLGQHFVDRTATPIKYLIKTESRDSNKRGCTKVIIVGKNSSITGSSGSGNLTRVFEYLSASTVNECNNLAEILLTDLQNTNVTYELTLTTDIVCNVGDYINIDGINQVVTKKVTTFDQIKISTEGLITTSVIDILGDSLTEISGETVSGTDAQWNGGTQNVAGDGSTLTSFKFECKDYQQISNFVLKFGIGAFQISTGVAATTEYLSVPSLLTNSSSVTGSSLFPDGYTYLPSTSGVEITGMTNGYQFAMMKFLGTLESLAYGDGIYIVPQYSINGGSNWINLPTEQITPSNGTTSPISWSALLPGSNNTTLRVRWGFYPDSGANTIKTFGLIVFHLQVVSKHVHSVSTTYDKSTSGTVPSNLYYQIVCPDSSVLGWYSFANGATTDISNVFNATHGSGTYIFNVKSAGGGAKGSCTLTASYQTLGKS